MDVEAHPHGLQRKSPRCDGGAFPFPAELSVAGKSSGLVAVVPQVVSHPLLRPGRPPLHRSDAPVCGEAEPPPLAMILAPEGVDERLDHAHPRLRGSPAGRGRAAGGSRLLVRSHASRSCHHESRTPG